MQDSAPSHASKLHNRLAKALKMENSWHDPLLHLAWTLLRSFGSFSSERFTVKVNSETEESVVTAAQNLDPEQIKKLTDSMNDRRQLYLSLKR